MSKWEGTRQRVQHGDTERTETHGGCRAPAVTNNRPSRGGLGRPVGSGLLAPRDARWGGIERSRSRALVESRSARDLDLSIPPYAGYGRRASSPQRDSLRASPFAPFLRVEPVLSVLSPQGNVAPGCVLTTRANKQAQVRREPRRVTSVSHAQPEQATAAEGMKEETKHHRRPGTKEARRLVSRPERPPDLLLPDTLQIYQGTERTKATDRQTIGPALRLIVE